MKNFNIIDSQNNTIGNGVIDKNYVRISEIKFNQKKYCDLEGQFNNSGFVIKNNSIFFTVNNVNNQSFNIIDQNGQYLAIARIY